MGTNIFKLLKIESKENFHSRFIAEVLKHDKKAKELFIFHLNKAIEKCNSSKPKIYINHSDYKILNEKTLKGNKENRVDIFLHDHPSLNRIIIENKIYAGDQPNQLSRYHSYLIKEQEKPYCGTLFYLTLEGKDATNYSKKKLRKNENYFLISYKREIKNWLDEILINKEVVLDAKMKVFVEDYKQIINDLIKPWHDLESSFDKDESMKSDAQKSYLELRFWEYLENRIFENFRDKVPEISDKRLYNYVKISKGENEKKEKTRDYGIILKLELKDKRGVFIGVSKEGNNKHKIFINNVVFDDLNKDWIVNKENNIYTQYRTDELVNKPTMEDVVSKVINQLASIL